MRKRFVKLELLRINNNIWRFRISPFYSSLGGFFRKIHRTTQETVHGRVKSATAAVACVCVCNGVVVFSLSAKLLPQNMYSPCMQEIPGPDIRATNINSNERTSGVMRTGNTVDFNCFHTKCEWNGKEWRFPSKNRREAVNIFRCQIIILSSHTSINRNNSNVRMTWQKDFDSGKYTYSRRFSLGLYRLNLFDDAPCTYRNTLHLHLHYTKWIRWHKSTIFMQFSNFVCVWVNVKWTRAQALIFDAGCWMVLCVGRSHHKVHKMNILEIIRKRITGKAHEK